MRKLLLASILFAVSGIAADFTGNWSGEALVNGETHPLYFMLKQDGSALAGSGGPNESEQHSLQNGKIEGDRIVFDVPLAKGNLHFELTLESGDLKGTVQLKSDERNESGTVFPETNGVMVWESPADRHADLPRNGICQVKLDSTRRRRM